MLKTRKIIKPTTNNFVESRKSITDRLPALVYGESGLQMTTIHHAERKRSYVLNRGQSKLPSTSRSRQRKHNCFQMNIEANKMNADEVITQRSTKELLSLLQRIMRIVRTLCRVSLAIRRYAVNKNDSRIMMDIQNYLKPPYTDNLSVFNKDSNRGNLYFNKHVFSMDSNHAFPSWARHLCNLTPSDRFGDGTGVERLRSYLRGHPSFSQFDEHIQKVLVRNVMYHRYDRKRIILNQGDNPEYYYIMISGCVYVNISHRDVNTGVEITKTVDELKGQSSFGATALMYDTKRTASVVCDSFVEVLMVDADTFKEHCVSFLLEQHNLQKDFLNSHQIFSSWSDRRMKLLSYDVKCRDYRAKKVIDCDLLNSKYVYFVMKGSVDILYNNASDKHEWLHSDKLNRQVGILGGNRIYAPDACNIKRLGMKSVVGVFDRSVKVFLVSNEVTILCVPRSRLQEVAPKNFLSFYDFQDEFDYLSVRDYEKQKRKAIQWMEYRDKMTQNLSKSYSTTAKVNLFVNCKS